VIAFPFAHAGHWFVSLLYILPLVIIAIVATVVTIKERRRGVEPDAHDDEEVPRRNS
jgi:hypothetical protein